MIKLIKKTKDEQNNYHSYNDEPAIAYSNGAKEWYHSGKLHREDGPAAIYSNGTKEWWHHGKLHRENGPAIEYENGDKEWYIHGKEYTFYEWIKLSSLPEEQKIELMLEE